MQTAQSTQLPGKPIVLRVIFILNALMMFLPFVFYYVVTSKGIDAGIDPQLMVYTGLGYISTFAILVYSILKRNFTLFRVIIFVNVLVAIPAKAFIGIGVAIISMILTFTKKIKGYFLVE